MTESFMAAVAVVVVTRVGGDKGGLEEERGIVSLWNCVHSINPTTCLCYCSCCCGCYYY